MSLDWHSAPLTRDTGVDENYKNTQNVRRFMREQCGESFTFNREFMAWIVDGTPKSMGDVVDEWVKRRG